MVSILKLERENSMAESIIKVGGFLFDIVSKLLEYTQEKKKERELVDGFRGLILCHSDVANQFATNALNIFVPHTVLKTKKEEKLKRLVARYCIFIPEVIAYSGFLKNFPEMEEIKRHLFEFLRKFEPMSLSEIQQEYSESVSKISHLFTYENKEVSVVKNELLKFIDSEPMIEIKLSELPVVSESYKQKFYNTIKLDPNPKNNNFRYIDNMVTGLIKEDLTFQADEDIIYP